MGNYKTYFKISSNCFKKIILKFVKDDLPPYISDIFLTFLPDLLKLNRLKDTHRKKTL